MASPSEVAPFEKCTTEEEPTRYEIEDTTSTVRKTVGIHLEWLKPNNHYQQLVKRHKRAPLVENVSFERRSTKEDPTRYEGKNATSRRRAAVDHQLRPSALMKTKTSKR
uniref:Uncharacterized protein n=1 Tax=Angiostrongylus cantonensis TaxID=6313 RepID=A0A0K0DLN4_ANGCA